MNTIEVDIEKTQKAIIVLSLEDFTNEELAAFHLGLTGFGKISQRSHSWMMTTLPSKSLL